MITLSHISLEKNDKLLLDDVNFSVQPGEFICIIGRGGNAIFQLLLGLVKPTKGTVYVDDCNLHALPLKFLQCYRRSIGLVGKEHQLLSHRTVAQNIMFPLEACRKDRKAIEKRTRELLQLLHFEEKADVLPEELKERERKNVALARALANEPKILLLEEILDPLDEENAKRLLSTLRDINFTGTTILLTTRRSNVVKKLRTRTLVLENGTLVSETQIDQPAESQESKKNSFRKGKTSITLTAT